MAVVETYLSQLQYTNTVNDLKEDLDRRNAHDLDSSSSDEGARVQVHATHKKPQGQPWRMPAQEKGLHQRHHGKALRKRPQAKHAARLDDWLSQQDFGRTFTHKSGALDPQAGPDGQAPNPLRPAYTRHHILRLAKGTAWDRIMGALSWLNKTLPIYLPTSPGRRWWEVFIMLLVLYNAAAVPLDISFGMPSTGRIVTYLEYAVDLIFAADICGNFRAAYIDHMGYLIRDTGQIAANYLKFWFWIDL